MRSTRNRPSGHRGPYRRTKKGQSHRCLGLGRECCFRTHRATRAARRCGRARTNARPASPTARVSQVATGGGSADIKGAHLPARHGRAPVVGQKHGACERVTSRAVPEAQRPERRSARRWRSQAGRRSRWCSGTKRSSAGGSSPGESETPRFRPLRKPRAPRIGDRRLPH